VTVTLEGSLWAGDQEDGAPQRAMRNARTTLDDTEPHAGAERIVDLLKPLRRDGMKALALADFLRAQREPVSSALIEHGMSRGTGREEAS
jgi:hypothetical protein